MQLPTMKSDQMLSYMQQIKKATELSLKSVELENKRHQHVSKSGKAGSPRGKKLEQNCVVDSSDASIACTTTSGKQGKRKLIVNQKKPEQFRVDGDISSTSSYIDSQKFVDVDVDGCVSRLNICNHLEIVSPGSMWDEKEDSEKENSPNKIKPSSVKDDCVAVKVEIERLPQPSFRVLEDSFLPPEIAFRSEGFYRFLERSPDEFEEDVEYDLDKEDFVWLELINKHRTKSRLHRLSEDKFEMAIDRLEKQAFLVTEITGKPNTANDADEEDIFCAICLDDECQNSNVILLCDMCNLAVHQDCYGVPYVPEGQWLCSKCQHSPTKPVSCCLCPVVGGAVKQTDDGRWAHILCALWIPEVGFGNIEFLEPITKIDKIPPGRNKLMCSICKQKKVGASIQCMKKNCYTAFHIMCAQQVGTYMLIEPTPPEDGTPANVRKSFFCDRHKPEGAKPFRPMYETSGDDEDDNSGTVDCPASSSKAKKSNSKKKKSKKKKSGRASNAKSSTVECQVPAIPTDRLLDIASECFNVSDSISLMNTVYHYWILKRRAQNNLPLLRRLHTTGSTHKLSKLANKDECETFLNEIKNIKRIRQDMEKVRLLLELVRKREKLKLVEIRTHEQLLHVQLDPLNSLLHKTLDQLQEKDRSNIFAYPVPVEQVPGYLDKVNKPMDFSTMRYKIERHAYQSLQEFEVDFDLVINNCLKFNAKQTIFYKAATRLRQQAEDIFTSANEAASASADLCNFVPKLNLSPELDNKEDVALDRQTELPRIDHLDEKNLREEKENGCDPADQTAQHDQVVPGNMPDGNPCEEIHQDHEEVNQSLVDCMNNNHQEQPTHQDRTEEGTKDDQLDNDVKMMDTAESFSPKTMEKRRSSDRVKTATHRYLIDDDDIISNSGSPRKRKHSVEVKIEDPPVLSRCPSPVDELSDQSPSKRRKIRKSPKVENLKPPRLVKSVSRNLLRQSLKKQEFDDWEDLIPVTQVDIKRQPLTDKTLDPPDLTKQDSNSSHENLSEETSKIPDLEVENTHTSQTQVLLSVENATNDTLDSVSSEVATAETAPSNSIAGMSSDLFNRLTTLENVECDSAYSSPSSGAASDLGAEKKTVFESDDSK